MFSWWDGICLLIDTDAFLKRWTEHVDGILNRQSSVSDEAFNRRPLAECNPLPDEFPTVSEILKAIKLMSSGNASGSDAIPAYIYKAGGPIYKVISHYVEKRSHPLRIQGCNNYPHMQTERESSSLWQSSGHLFIVSCWEDPCKSPAEPIEWTHWTVRASTRKSVWI